MEVDEAGELRDMATLHCRKALDLLIHVLRDEGQDMGDRLRAAIFILEVAGVVGAMQELD